MIAYANFPNPHWPKLWSTNPIERLNTAIKGGADLVGISPRTTVLLNPPAPSLLEPKKTSTPGVGYRTALATVLLIFT